MAGQFEPRDDLRIGKIVEVSGNSIRIELDGHINELTRSIDGRVYPIGQMASIIKIHFGRKIIFAYVRSLRMRSEVLAEEGESTIHPGDDSRMLEADLFGQGVWSKKTQHLVFTRGVETYPLPMQAAFLCLNDELESVYKAAEVSAEHATVSPMVPIGQYVGSNNAVARANIDKMFGHHCAILGSTGSGKSGTVASILHSVIDHSPDGEELHPRIVIIDPHGEYASAFSEKAILYRAYADAAVAQDDFCSLSLPYWLMTSDEFRSFVIGKTEYEATAQNNMVYEALTYARLVEAGIVKSVGDDPEGGATAELEDGKTEDDRLNFDRDRPTPFKLSEFITHLDKVQGRKQGNKANLAPSSSERGKLDAILKKTRVLLSNPQLSFMMTEWHVDGPSLNSILMQFVGNVEGKDLRIIDISGLPNEVAGPLTALIGRLLFQYKLWQKRDERKRDPVLFVCEEAHRYVPNRGEAQYKEAQQAIRRIAKEGRKYGLGLLLVSQRPSDVEGTVLSQCNSWIVLRLTNPSDQEHVAKFLPDNLAGLTKMLPSLTRREAIFVGEAAALPSRIRITKLPKEKLPDSEDISFASGWTNQMASEDELSEVVGRWCGSGEDG